MKIPSVLLATAISGAAFAQDNAPDLDLMTKASEAFDQMRTKIAVPGFRADGERTEPGRFTLEVVEPDRVYLLDTASGRIWRVQDRTLLPLVESPETWFLRPDDESADEERKQ